MHLNSDFNASTYVLIHGSAGTGVQWREMVSLFPHGVRCLCPDLVGYSFNAPFNHDCYYFQHDVQIVEDTILSAKNPVTLVGHSFGGVVALAVAMAHPERVDKLVLIEPVAFALLDTDEHRASYAKVLAFCDSITELAGAGRLNEAAQTFFGFWEMSDLWHSLSDNRKKTLGMLMPKVAAECALIHTPAFTAYDITRRLATPTLVIQGSASLRLMREVCKIVAHASPYCTTLELPGCNHLSPLLHPKEVLAAILRFAPIAP